MSALMLVLLAGLTASDGGRMQPSQQTKETFLGRGHWEGTCKGWPGHTLPEWNVVIAPDKLLLLKGGNNVAVDATWRWADEGRGRCRLTVPEHKLHFVGIYRREMGTLVIALRLRDDGYPRGYQPSEKQALLVLRPGKPPR